jgi:hypothetical protein
MVFLTQNRAKLCKNAENWQKSTTIVIITSTPSTTVARCMYIIAENNALLGACRNLCIHIHVHVGM